MHPLKASAHRAGALYFVFSVVAVIGEFGFPAFLVPGDAAATAQNITAAEFTFRLGVVAGLATHVLFLVLVVSLYSLFREVHRTWAVLMVVLVAVGVAVALAGTVPKAAPLILLSGSGELAALSLAQVQALSLGALRLHGAVATVAMAFWGLWLFPFGLLVYRSGFLPRVLGVLILLAGIGYLATSVTGLLLPEHRQAVARYMMPLYFGELPIVFWLLLKGARVPPAPA